MKSLGWSTWVLAAALGLSACSIDGMISSPSDPAHVPGTGGAGGGEPGGGGTGGGGGGGGGGPTPSVFTGADGRDLTQSYIQISSLGAQKRQPLDYSQLRAELIRFTGKDWTGDWNAVKNTLGAADVANQRFADDPYPTSAKFQQWQTIVTDVCAELIAREAATPQLFSEYAPTQTINTGSQAFKNQLQSFIERAVQSSTVAQGLVPGVLTFIDDIKTGRSPNEVWGAVCIVTLMDVSFTTY